MIVSRFHHVLRNTDDATAGGGLSITDDGPDRGGEGRGFDAISLDDETDRPDPNADRGDNLVLEPETPATPATEDPKGNTRPTPDAGGEEETEEETQARRTSAHVPISRFNQVNEDRKAAELEAERLRAELAALKAGTTTAPAPAPANTPAQAPAAQAPAAAPATPEFDVKAANRQYAELLADGEFDKAADLKEQIDGHNIALAEQRAIERIERQNRERAEQSEARAATEVANEVVAEFPFFGTDPAAQATLLAERDRLMTQEGKSMREAIRAAADKFGPALASIYGGAPAANTPGKGLPQNNAAVDTRTRAAIERGARQSTQQPAPLTGGMGNAAPSAKLDPMTMTEEQFENLSAAEKAKLRGD